MKKNNKTTVFTYLNQIYNKNNHIKYDKKIASAYLISLWLSHDNEFLKIVNKINENYLLFTMPDHIVYNYYYDSIPKGQKYLKWDKKTKFSNEKENRIIEITKEYNVSKKEAGIIFSHEEAVNKKC